MMRITNSVLEEAKLLALEMEPDTVTVVPINGTGLFLAREATPVDSTMLKVTTFRLEESNLSFSIYSST